MARGKAQYQPLSENGHSASDAQEVHYAKEFKRADIAGGHRKEKVREVKQEDR